MTELPTTAGRIGGRWAVSWQAWALISVLTIVGTFISIPTNVDTTQRDRLLIVAVGVVAGLALGLAMLIAARTVLRHRAETPVSVTTIIVLGGVFGLVHALASIALYALLGVPDFALNPAARIVFSTGIAPAVFIAISVILDELDRYRHERDALITRLVTLREQQVERSGLTASIEAAVQAEIRVATDPIIADLGESTRSLTEAQRFAMADRLQMVATEELRPLSQRLFTATYTPVRPSGVARALWATLLNQPIIPGASSLITATFFLVFSTARYGLTVGAAQYVAQAALMYAVLKPLADYDRRRVGARVPTLLIGALAVLGITAAKGIVFQTLIADDPLFAGTIVATFWAPCVTVAVSITAAAIQRRRGALNDLELVVDEQTLDAIIANRELVRVSRELAQHVHGTLQSTLLATAFAIEQATRTNDGAAFERAVEEARIALQTTPRLIATETDLRAEVERRLDLWREFTDVDARIDVVGPVPPTVVRQVGQALEEAISNAKKHGRARHLHVAVTQEPGAIRLQVADDGSGPVAGPPGMGSAVFDEIAPGGWRLDPRADGGALLTIAVPLAD